MHDKKIHPMTETRESEEFISRLYLRIGAHPNPIDIIQLLSCPSACVHEFAIHPWTLNCASALSPSIIFWQGMTKLLSRNDDNRRWADQRVTDWYRRLFACGKTPQKQRHTLTLSVATSIVGTLLDNPLVEDEHKILPAPVTLSLEQRQRPEKGM